ncbi:hypothetical protein NEMBOFW57_002912 [Staphylotrichum longicolle]|uniref:Non-canonical purine NTP phosphatase/PRRC1 domain-containing protein n=1 Tax=Staphylotrichum longicolle TaxID=669026 RepID=A0AAD4F6W7_9PEZI|nr:hypothetical protein NEMBOFW57_002912 [Staphylotrichum longicolle]
MPQDPQDPPAVAAADPDVKINPKLKLDLNVLLVIPTANKFKTNLLTTRLAAEQADRKELARVAVSHLTVKADSGVGEQPYDAAGPRGAFNRVVNAVRDLAAGGGGGKHGDVLARERIGTVVVGAVENFLLRETGKEGGKDGEPRAVVVDYGVIVLCRISLVAGGSAGGDGDGDGDKGSLKWEWRTGVSKGVTAPVEYWRWAEEQYGFEDEARMYGKKTVGKVLAEHIDGLDDANWHEALAGVSRYDLLEETMAGMEVPWPQEFE